MPKDMWMDHDRGDEGYGGKRVYNAERVYGVE